MEILFINIVKSSGLMGMFFIAYYLLLRKETFFTANRWFLLAGLFTSVILPWIVFTTIVWVEPTANTVDWSKIPVTTSIEKESFEINWYLVLAVVYAIGIVLFLTQFAFDFYKLKRILKGKTFYRQADHKFIDLQENIAPFSYFNTIVYNSSLYSKSEMESILEHEKVHSEQYHTVDVLIARFFCILFWFNPFVWLYKKAILQNLEFIADSEAAKNISDKKAYQLALLKITTQDNCVAITNHFYQSLIKKRIIMLNKNQSKKWNSWKYALVFPALVAFVLLFQIEVVAQEKVTKKQENPKKAESIDLASFNIKKDLTSYSKGKEIYIDGVKSSENELTKMDTKEIESMVVVKKNDKPTILVTTKHPTSRSTKNIKISQNDIHINEKKINTSNKTVDVTTVKNKKIAENERPISIINEKVIDSKIKIGDNNPDIIDIKTDQQNDEKEKNRVELPQEKVVQGFTINSTEKSDKTYFGVNGPITLPPIIIMNGVKINSISNVNEINPSAIKVMSVLKGEMAEVKYGKAGKYGAIEITTNTLDPSKIMNKVVVGYPISPSGKK